MALPAGSCESAPIVHTLTAYKLIQYSDSQNQYVTGDAIALANVIMDGMGLGPNSYIDAATLINSTTHLVLSDEMLRQCVPEATCPYCGFGQVARKVTQVTPHMAKAFAAAADTSKISTESPSVECCAARRCARTADGFASTPWNWPKPVQATRIMLLD